MTEAARKEATELETMFDSFEPVHVDGVATVGDESDAVNSPMAWIWTWRFEEVEQQ